MPSTATPLTALLKHSPCARAIVGVLETAERSPRPGACCPVLQALLSDRHRPSTVRHELRQLVLAERVVDSGRRLRVRCGRLVRVWRVA